MDRLALFFKVSIFVILLPKDYTVELSVNSSITDKCPGDVISVLCSTTNNEMKWVWQSNDLTESYVYLIHRFTDTLFNVSHTFSRIQSVTTTLLNISRQPLYLKSSLQYVVSSEYLEANIECSDFMVSPTKAVQVTTKNCSLGSQDFYLFQNNSILMLCHNGISDHNYNYIVQINTQNESISQFRYANNTKELVIQCGMDYFINVTTECCRSTVTLANFNFQYTNCDPGEISNISVALYFVCNHSTLNNVYTKGIPTSDSVQQNYNTFTSIVTTEISYSSNLVTADASEEDSITCNTWLLVSTVILSCGFSCQCIIIVVLCAVNISTTKNKRKSINSNIREQMFMKPREIEQIRKDSDVISIGKNSAYGIVKRSLLQN